MRRGGSTAGSRDFRVQVLTANVGGPDDASAATSGGGTVSTRRAWHEAVRASVCDVGHPKGEHDEDDYPIRTAAIAGWPD